MASADYWVEISWEGTRLGAGFLLNKHHALTASHCLRSIGSDDERLELSFASGEVASAQVCERSSRADLALVHILKPCEGTLTVPRMDRAYRGDMWSTPYRPSTGDPYLGGSVLRGAISYRCEGGHEIEALQLDCSQRIGDYSGYSGGPVERHSSDRAPRLLGVLLEQYPDRQASERASDVLFAATMAEVYRHFDCLGAGYLMDALSSEGTRPEEYFPVRTSHRLDTAGDIQELQESHGSKFGSPLEARIAAANSLRDFIHEWANSGTLDPMYVSALMLRVALRVVESNWTDDA